MHNKEELNEKLVNEYLKLFYTFALSRTISIDKAEELLQMILYECVKAIHCCTEIRNERTYFWSIAHNIYKRYLKEKKAILY